MPLIEMMEHVPLWLVGLIVMIVAEVYAVGLMLSTRAIYGVSRLAENNEVAGFKFAVVGVFYAVLLAFVVIAVGKNSAAPKPRSAMRPRLSSIFTTSLSRFQSKAAP